MKVIVVSTPVFKLPLMGYGGLEIVAWQQAAGLAQRGHEVALVAPDGSECPGVQIVPCGPAGQVDERMAYGGFPEHKEGDKVLRRAHAGYWPALREFDVVLDHSWQKWSYALKAEGVVKAPILGWFHAPVNTMYGSWPPLYPRMPGVEKACPVCISEDQADHFRALHNRDARVCYNGIDPEFYKAVEGIPRTPRYLFLARFSTIKGADIAIDACLKAGVGLDLVGDVKITNEPEYYEHCRRLAEHTSPDWNRERDGKQINIMGGCSRGEAVMLYSKAHVLIHSAKNFREPFGLAPVEAMACGLPVLCYDNGAMRETVASGCGKVVRTDGELVNAIKDTAMGVSNDTRHKCRNNAVRFTVDRMVARVEELCELAVKTGGW